MRKIAADSKERREDASMKVCPKAAVSTWMIMALWVTAAAGEDLQLTGIETTNGVRVTGTGGVAGNGYDLQWADSLVGKVPWKKVGANLAEEDGSFDIVDEMLNGTGFYCVRKNMAVTVAQTGIAAAMQDYVKAIKSLGNQSDTQYDMFLSGDLADNFIGSRYHYSGLYYDSTNLWNGKASDWLPTTVKSSADLNAIKDMEWIWVRQKPNTRSLILGRYAYVGFNISGGVDANLLGLDYGMDLPANGYGAQTHRNNVRRMLLNSGSAFPSTDTTPQYRLAQYRALGKGFATPAVLNSLADGEIGPFPADHLSCYSRAATHKGEKKPCTGENIVNSDCFSRLISAMGGGEQTKSEVRKALEDYMSESPIPQGTDYPSVKAVPMFNEIMCQVKIEKNENQWQLKVTITPEFWCPFPSMDNADGDTFVLEAPTMGGGSAVTGDADIWIHFLAATPGGPSPSLTLEQVSVMPSSYTISKTVSPHSFGSFEYTLNINGIPLDDNGNVMEIWRIAVRGIIFNHPWFVTHDGHNVDATPYGEENLLAFPILPSFLTPSSGQNTGIGGMECDDPRLNHDMHHWNYVVEDTTGAPNSCLAEAKAHAREKMGYEPGAYMYCRNGKMESPAELGYIPIYDGSTPWMTLDIFSDYGIELMNSLVCDDSAWTVMNNTGVFYTNGTINPYTRDSAVFNGAFHGLDIREVPNMSGTPNDTTEVIGAERAKELSAEIVKNKAPDSNTFVKDGPAGWARVLRWNGFIFNKNERIALARNTWGLFNESDSLFLVFVIAQSINEASDEVDPVGTWNENTDMISGSRVAVALCWMDTSAEMSSDPTQAMEIIAFKYLDE